MEVTNIDKSPPPSPDSKGFGFGAVLPYPLEVETVGVGYEEMVPGKRGKGIPRRGEQLVCDTSVNVNNIVILWNQKDHPHPHHSVL